MAIFIATTKSISRSNGQSAVASASYRAGEKLHDERYGKNQDYSNRHGVIGKDIILPSHLKDKTAISRNDLWNMAEQAEKRKDSRVAREWIVNLPHELDEKTRKDLAHTFAQKLADKYGVIADCCIHEPTQKEVERGADPRNFHAHIMLTTRQAELTADNQIKLGDKATIELSDTKRRSLGLERVSEEITEIRQLWEHTANEKLAEHGHELIDSRSYKSLGIDIEPQIKMGKNATQMERDGIQTPVGDLNRMIKERNELVFSNELAEIEKTNKFADEIIFESRKAHAKPDIATPAPPTHTDPQKQLKSAIAERIAEIKARTAQTLPEQPKEIKKQSEVTAVTEPLPAPPTPKNDWLERAKQRKAEKAQATPAPAPKPAEPTAPPAPKKPITLESPNKPIEPPKDKKVIDTTIPPIKSLETPNRPPSEPSISDIIEKKNLIKDYAEKVHTTAKAILDSQLKALREKAKPILEKYNILKDSKPLMFGKDQWEKDKNTTLNAYNTVKNTHDTMKDKGITDEHYKQAREHIAKNEPSYHDKVQQAIKDIESHEQAKQDKTSKAHGADFHAKKGVTYSGEIMRADEKGVIQKTRDGLVYHPHSSLDVKEGKSYNICNKGDHYTTQPAMEIKTPAKSQDKDIQR